MINPRVPISFFRVIEVCVFSKLNSRKNYGGKVQEFLYKACKKSVRTISLFDVDAFSVVCSVLM